MEVDFDQIYNIRGIDFSKFMYIFYLLCIIRNKYLNRIVLLKCPFTGRVICLLT